MCVGRRRREERRKSERKRRKREATVALVAFKEKALGDEGQGF